MKKIELSIDIDGLFALGKVFPLGVSDLVEAVGTIIESGASSVSVRWKKDAEYCNNIRNISENASGLLNLKIPLSDEALKFATELRPDTVVIYDDSEGICGAVDFNKDGAKISEITDKLFAADISAGILSDTDAGSIRLAHNSGIDIIEFSADPFIDAEGRIKDVNLENLQVASYFVKELSMRVHLCGDINYANAAGFAAVTDIDCFETGLPVISKGMIVGLKNSVALMKETING